MRINYLKTKNYRQLKDINIEFANGINDLHLIIGENGLGKTNLLNSINWCLYNDEPHLGDESRALPLPNKEMMKEIGIDNNIEVIVELEIEADDRKCYHFKRSNKYRIINLFPYTVQYIDSVWICTEIPEDGNAKIHLGEEATQFVNKLIPHGIRDFFFFDGEQLDKYFIESTSSNIKNAISEISQINLLERIADDRLKNVISEYRREMSSGNHDLDDITNKINEITMNRDRTLADIETVRNQLKTANARIYELNEFLKGKPDLEEEEKKRDSLRKEIQDLEEEKKELEVSESEIIRKYTILINLRKAFVDTKNLINQKEKDKSLPPKIDKKSLEDSINNCCCELCRQKISEDSKRIIAEAISKIDTSSESSQKLLQMRYSINNFIDESVRFETVLEQIKNKKERNNSLLDTKNQEYNKLYEYIQKYGNGDSIKNAYKERDSLQDHVPSFAKKQANIEAQVNKDNDDIKRLEFQFGLKSKENERNAKLHEEYQFATKVRDFVNGVKTSVMNEYKEKIRKQTEDNFLNLVWKKESFSHITIEDDFSIGLKDDVGTECLGSCSAAERALLALSFTLALHTISGFGRALVIDTPLARIAGENRKNFTKILLEISKGEQIILLFTSGEYTEDVSGIIGNNYATKQTYITNAEKYSTLEGAN